MGFDTVYNIGQGGGRSMTTCRRIYYAEGYLSALRKVLYGSYLVGEGFPAFERAREPESQRVSDCPVPRADEVARLGDSEYTLFFS